MTLPEKYYMSLPAQLRPIQKKLISASQRKYEATGKVEARPKVSNQKVPRSQHAKLFESKYGFSVSELDKVKKLFPDTDVDTILSKGRAAYMSSGSRPNTTPEAWAKARLASALTGGKAYKIDKSHIGPKSKAVVFG